MDTTSFGEKIRELREAKGYSLRELAKLISVSAPFLSDIELGRRYPATATLEVLARHLDVAVEELKRYDFREEAEDIKKMMFANPAAGLAFRTMASQIKDGIRPEDILKKLRGER